MESKRLAEALRLERLMPHLMSQLFAIDDDSLIHHLSAAQLRLMRMLQSGPGTSGDLGTKLGLSPSSMTQMIARLEHHGFVHKEPGDSDRRTRRVALTEEGESMMQERSEARAMKAARTLERLSGEEMSELMELLERLASPVETPLEMEAIV